MWQVPDSRLARPSGHHAIMRIMGSPQVASRGNTAATEQQPCRPRLTCEGCCPGPSPALKMGTEATAAALSAEPAWKCRNTITSAYCSMVRMVSAAAGGSTEHSAQFAASCNRCLERQAAAAAAAAAVAASPRASVGGQARRQGNCCKLELPVGFADQFRDFASWRHPAVNPSAANAHLPGSRPWLQRRTPRRSRWTRQCRPGGTWLTQRRGVCVLRAHRRALT